MIIWISICVIFSVNHLMVDTMIADLLTKDLTTDEFQLDCLLSHNTLRERHCSSPIKYSTKLKLFATRRATLLARTNGLGVAQINNTGFGENIYRFKSENSSTINCKSIVQNWYKEKVYHRWNTTADVGPYSRHFAQILWNSTQRIGCASVATVGAISWVYSVCNYYNLHKFPQNSNQNLISIAKCDHILSNRKFKYSVLTTGLWLQECIREHNRIRKLHSVVPLVINDEIFQSSQKRALEMAQKGFRFFRHKPSDLGENIHWSKAVNNSQPMSCNESITKWYQELSNYNWEERFRHNGTVRHFIQLVWRLTSAVGCAQVQNIEEPKGGIYTVCLYQPKANFKNSDLQWENVFPDFTRTTTPGTPVTEASEEHVEGVDDETELEKEFKDVDDIIYPRKEYQKQTPALTLEDMFIKTSTEGTGFNRNEYDNKWKGSSRRKD